MEKNLLLKFYNLDIEIIRIREFYGILMFNEKNILLNNLGQIVTLYNLLYKHV